MFRNYDPAKHTLSFKGIIILGFDEGTFIKAERSQQAFMKKVGATGDVTRARNRDRTGMLTFTLMKGSPANDLLSAVQIADELTGLGYGPLLMKDLSGTSVVQADNAWIQKMPDFEAAVEPGGVQWILDMEVMNLFVGGLLS